MQSVPPMQQLGEMHIRRAPSTGRALLVGVGLSAFIAEPQVARWWQITCFNDNTKADRQAT